MVSDNQDLSLSAVMNNKKPRLYLDVPVSANPLGGAFIANSTNLCDDIKSSSLKRKQPNRSVVDENGSDDNSSEVSVASSLGSTASKSPVKKPARPLCCERSRSYHMNGSFFQNPELIKNATHVALDCEFLGVGPQGRQSALGRCSVVDYEGRIVCDIFAKPEEPVTDYRTRWSGLCREQSVHAIPVASAKRIIREVLQGKIIVGHSLHNDFSVLGIHVSPSQIRDLAKCALLQKMAASAGGPSGIIGLKRLSNILLGRNIQTKIHCSIEDARATMDLYRLVDKEWEASVAAADRQAATSISSRSVSMMMVKSASKRTISESYLADEYWPENL